MELSIWKSDMRSLRLSFVISKELRVLGNAGAYQNYNFVSLFA